MTVLAAGLILSALASAPITVAFQHARGVQPGAQKRPTVPLCARVRPLRVHMPDSVRQDNVLGPVIDDREWKAWTSRFSGKFVTKSGTATLTSRRAAAEEGGEAGGEIAVLQLDAGRSLSNEDLDAIAAAAGDVQSDFIANLREWMDSDGGAWGEDAADSSASVHGSSGKIETKTLLYLLAQGRVAVKAVVPRDPSSLIDKFIQASDQQPAPASSQEYIPYWVQLWPSAMVLADEFASGRIGVVDKRVLELSGGLGLPVVTAAVMGAEDVMVTEYDDACLAEVERNALANRVGVRTSRFDWFRPTGSDIMMAVDEWDVICLADVMYEESFVKPVAQAVRKLLRQNRHSKVVFVDPQRKNLPEFCEQLRALNLEVEHKKRRMVVYKADSDSALKSERHVISILHITCAEH